MEKIGYVYVLTNSKKKVLYIGVTSNLQRRVYEHQNGLVSGFAKKYGLKRLIYYEVFDTVVDAIRREKYLKGKSRQKKEILISSLNSEWKDLSERLYLL